MTRTTESTSASPVPMAGAPLLLLGGSEVGQSGADDTCRVGTTARIVDFNSLPDGLLGISCIGESKFTVQKRWQQSDGLHVGDIEFASPEERYELPEEYRHLGDLLRKVLPELGELYVNVPKHFDDASWVGYR